MVYEMKTIMHQNADMHQNAEPTAGSAGQGRRGGAAMEFAFVLPVLLLLALPIADFTWYFLSMQHVQEAAWSGARVGARMTMEEDPAGMAVMAATDTLTASMPWAVDQASITASIVDTDIVRVEVKVPFDALAGYIATPPDLHVAYKLRIEDP